MEKFGGVECDITDYKHASVVFLPVPYDGTSTWIKGADKGPEALLDASANMEFYDIETDSEVFRKGFHTAEPVTEASSPETMSQAVEQRMRQLLDDGKFPVLLGGEHSVSIGAIRAVAKHYQEFSVLQLDAHSDMRDEYEGSSHNHACIMARAKEVATNCTQVGIRSSSTEERHNIDPKRIFYAYKIKKSSTWMQEATAQLCKNVYLTIDLDVLDPAYMPATGTPEPDGLSYRDILDFVAEVLKEHRLVGLDVVELCPMQGNRAPDFLAARLIYQILSMKYQSEK